MDTFDGTASMGLDSKRVGWVFFYFFHVRVARPNAEFAVVDKEFFIYRGRTWCGLRPYNRRRINSTFGTRD